MKTNVTMNQFETRNSKIIDLVGVRSTCHLSSVFRMNNRTQKRQLSSVTDKSLPWLDLSMGNHICTRQNCHQKLITVPRPPGLNLLGATTIDYSTQRPKRVDDLSKLNTNYLYFLGKYHIFLIIIENHKI